MKQIVRTFLIGCFVLSSFQSAKAIGDLPEYLSVGYLPNWAYSGYASLDYGALTHLNIAFCNPNTSGDLSAGINDTNLNAIIAKAHGSGVKVMASLGGAGYAANYPTLTSSTNRSMFCEKIINYAKKYNFDGIDLDVEGEAATSFWGANYEAWVAELKTRCDAENLLLTTAVGQWYADKITNLTFTYFDFVTIMEYDLKANNYQGRINYFLNTKGIPAKKLALGIPFFGHKNGEVAYKTIHTENPDAWYTSAINGYTYHNTQDIANIAVLSKTYRGIMIWELSQDVSGKYSLLGAVKSVLFGDGFVFPAIEKPVASVSITSATQEVMAGRVVQLTGQVAPADATVKTVLWSSSNSAVASVDYTGVVRGKTIGTTTITATSLEGNKKASVTVNVIANPNSGAGMFPDIYGIVSMYSNKAIDVKDKNLNPGARIQQWEMSSTGNNDHRSWLFELVSGNIYYIKSKFSGLYLTAMGNGNDGKIEQQYFTGNSNQQWEITETSLNVYSIKSVYAQRVMDVAGPSTANGAEIHLWENFSANNQLWKFQLLEPGPNTAIPTLDKPEKDIKAIEYYNLMGMLVSPETSGILIKKTRYSDRSVETTKEWVIK